MARSAAIKHDLGYLSTLPCGSIIAWHRDLTADHKPLLPPGWAECNGQTLDDPESPYNDHVIPNLNKDTGSGQRGLFLRGNTTSGVKQEDQMQSHTHADKGHDHEYESEREPWGWGGNNRNAPHVTEKRVAKNTVIGYARLEDPVDSQTGAGEPRHGNETRPINMSVIWIMKVKQVVAARATPAVQAAQNAPLGVVFVTEKGRVGVGTDTPAATLDVAGGDDSLAWGGDHSGSGYIRIGDLQICWGEVVIDVPASTDHISVNVDFPSGCEFRDANYRITLTMTSNYGNFIGFAMAMGKTESGASIRMCSGRPDTAQNSAGRSTADYIAIGPWR